MTRDVEESASECNGDDNNGRPSNLTNDIESNGKEESKIISPVSRINVSMCEGMQIRPIKERWFRITPKERSC